MSINDFHYTTAIRNAIAVQIKRETETVCFVIWRAIGRQINEVEKTIPPFSIKQSMIFEVMKFEHFSSAIRQLDHSIE